MRAECGVFDPHNECRCERVAACAAQRGLVRPEDLIFASHPRRAEPAVVDRATREMTQLMRVADVIRDHPGYAAPESMVARLRELLDSDHLELLRH
jgi:hypothetical protein